MSERQVFHSSHKGGQWHVLLHGEELSRHDTQHDAEANAIERAKKVHEDGGLSQVVCHNTIGGIREEFTYGKDPKRHKG